MRRFVLFVILCLGILHTYSNAHALVEPTWSGDNDLRARFLISDDADKIALYIQMQKGWHTYWYAPGEAGLPPRFDWEEKINIKSITPLWPVPQRFDEMGFTTFGYASEVLLPLTIQPLKAGHPMSANLTLNMMVCKDICIPKTLSLKLNTINVVSKNNGDHKILDQAYLPLLQKNSPEIKLENVQIHDNRIETVVSLPPNASADDIAELDMFAVLYDTPDAAPDQGVALTGKLTKTPADPHNPARVKLEIAKTDDIDNLNIHARGKTLRVVIAKDGHGIYQDIRLPSPQDTHTRKPRENQE